MGRGRSAVRPPGDALRPGRCCGDPGLSTLGLSTSRTWPFWDPKTPRFGTPGDERPWKWVPGSGHPWSGQPWSWHPQTWHLRTPWDTNTPWEHILLPGIPKPSIPRPKHPQNLSTPSLAPHGMSTPGSSHPTARPPLALGTPGASPGCFDPQGPPASTPGGCPATARGGGGRCFHGSQNHWEGLRGAMSC